MIQSPETDLGLSHVALVVRDLDKSIAFYQEFADLQVIHRRTAGGDIEEVAWMADGSRPFALVLVASTNLDDTPLGPFGHIGIACAKPGDVSRRAAEAERRGILRSAPRNDGPPVGLWTYISDPDGNTLELSFGQEIAFSIASGHDTLEVSSRARSRGRK
ncbi:VOC family protein [Pseudomonas aeruginosa]|uniref:VOC family protein n=1 Tax=Pseudomonas aeruginosa TaxID=287 RepID=UPI003966EF9E